jgi:hypothetical protein
MFTNDLLNFVQRNPEKLFPRIYLVHRSVGKVRMQSRFEPKRVVAEDYRMYVERKWHGRGPEFINSLLRIEPPSKALS